jgi:hypothetical protein
MLCLITYRRLAQSILLFHRYLLLYHPSVLPSLHEIFFFNAPEQKAYPRSTSLNSAQNFLSNEPLFAQIGLRTRELRPFYFGDEICPEISERATLIVFSITPCTGLQTRWFLMRWNGNLMELLDTSFSPFVHL